MFHLIVSHLRRGAEWKKVKKKKGWSWLGVQKSTSIFQTLKWASSVGGFFRRTTGLIRLVFSHDLFLKDMNSSTPLNFGNRFSKVEIKYSPRIMKENYVKRLFNDVVLSLCSIRGLFSFNKTLHLLALLFASLHCWKTLRTLVTVIPWYLTHRTLFHLFYYTHFVVRSLAFPATWRIAICLCWEACLIFLTSAVFKILMQL